MNNLIGEVLKIIILALTREIIGAVKKLFLQGKKENDEEQKKILLFFQPS